MRVYDEISSTTRTNRIGFTRRQLLGDPLFNTVAMKAMLALAVGRPANIGPYCKARQTNGTKAWDQPCSSDASSCRTHCSLCKSRRIVFRGAFVDAVLDPVFQNEPRKWNLNQNALFFVIKSTFILDMTPCSSILYIGSTDCCCWRWILCARFTAAGRITQSFIGTCCFTLRCRNVPGGIISTAHWIVVTNTTFRAPFLIFVQRSNNVASVRW